MPVGPPSRSSDGAGTERHLASASPPAQRRLPPRWSARFVTGAAARAERPRIYAITGARIVTAPGKVIENGTLVLRDGLIEAVGQQGHRAGRRGGHRRRRRAGRCTRPSSTPPRASASRPRRPPRRRRQAAAPERPSVSAPTTNSSPCIPRTRSSTGSISPTRASRGTVRWASRWPRCCRTRACSAASRPLLMLRSGQRRPRSGRRATTLPRSSRSRPRASWPGSTRRRSSAPWRPCARSFSTPQRQGEWSERYAANPAGMPPPEYRSSDAPCWRFCAASGPSCSCRSTALDPGRFRNLADEFGLHAT